MDEVVIERLRLILRSAVDIVNSIPEQYRESAYRIAAEYLIRSIQHPRSEAVTPSGRPLSIAEILTMVNPESQIETIVAICYYLEFVERINPITARDIRDGYSKARRTPGKNMSRDIAGCVEKGYLMQVSGGSGHTRAFQLTNTGVNFVETRIRVQ